MDASQQVRPYYSLALPRTPSTTIGRLIRVGGNYSSLETIPEALVRHLIMEDDFRFLHGRTELTWIVPGRKRKRWLVVIGFRPLIFQACLQDGK